LLCRATSGIVVGAVEAVISVVVVLGTVWRGEEEVDTRAGTTVGLVVGTAIVVGVSMMLVLVDIAGAVVTGVRSGQPRTMVPLPPPSTSTRSDCTIE